MSGRWQHSLGFSIGDFRNAVHEIDKARHDAVKGIVLAPTRAVRACGINKDEKLSGASGRLVLDPQLHHPQQFRWV